MTISLPGLRADSPASALALYGISHLLPRAEIRWSLDASGWSGEVSAPGCAGIDELAGRLVEAVKGDPVSTIGTLAKDVNELTPDSWRAGLQGTSAAVATVVSGLCAEAPLRAGGRVSLTPLCVYSFGTRGKLVDNAIKQDQTLNREDVAGLLTGPWHPKRGCNTLGLDPGARRQDGAIMGPDPSVDGVRGVPGLVPLALRGLAAVTPLPGPGAVRGGAFSRNGTTSFHWPVFTVPLRAAVLRLVAARNWRERTLAERAAAGVEAVYASLILRDERRLSFARRVA